MSLGSLGKQFMLRSRKAFKLIRFTASEVADGEIYYIKRRKRDNAARDEYLKKERRAALLDDDIFMIDILRQEMKPGDARL